MKKNGNKTINIKIRTLRMACTITPINAPFPQDLAFSGYVFSHMQKRIKPTSGKKKLRIAKAVLFSSLIVVNPLWFPQKGQYFALSSISALQ